MIKIKAGKSIIEYAHMVGAPIEEVVEWVSEFVNNPSETQRKYFPNTTEQSRAKEIKEYIELRLSESVKAHIQDQILTERIQNAKPEPCGVECPF